jgi:hypothetical protein
MLYIKQFLQNKWTPWIVDWVLTDIKVENIPRPLLLSKGVFKKCTYGFNQYLFTYRLIYLKIIEILDCILLDNQETFIEPHKHIHTYFPFLVFMYTDIGIYRKKFFWERAIKEIDFEEIESLAGDPITMVETWKRTRSDYLNYRGEIENRYAAIGFKEYSIAPRLKLIFDQVDEILENQRQQYSPFKHVQAKWVDKNTIEFKGEKLKFIGKRQKFLKMLTKNITGITGKELRDKVNLKMKNFKATKGHINKRLKTINLSVKFIEKDKVYKLIEIK